MLLLMQMMMAPTNSPLGSAGSSLLLLLSGVYGKKFWPPEIVRDVAYNAARMPQGDWCNVGKWLQQHQRGLS